MGGGTRPLARCGALRLRLACSRLPSPRPSSLSPRKAERHPQSPTTRAPGGGRHLCAVVGRHRVSAAASAAAVAATAAATAAAAAAQILLHIE